MNFRKLIGQSGLGIAAVALTLAGCSPGDSEQNVPDPQQPQAQSDPKTPAAATPAAYPLDTCVVSGQKLGSMGDPTVVKIEGRDVQICCSHCEEDLRKEPQKYLAKLDAAAKAPTTKPASAG
jgi:hypothetical protein